MASQVDVANLALGRLRVSKFINDLADQTTAAGICNRFMDQCRQEVLRAFPWNFATKAIQLAEVADQTFPGWAYVYAYPDDALMIRAVADEGGIRSARQSVFARSFDALSAQMVANPFQVALKDDAASRVLLSDVPSAWAFTTTDVAAVGLMPPDFISVWAWRLAMEVGGPLQADDARITRAEQSYGAWLSIASAQSFNESKDDPRQESPSISCRN